MAVFDDDQRAVLALWFVVNASLTSYYKLTKAFGGAALALQNADQWEKLSVHKSHMQRLASKADADAFVCGVADKVAKGVFGVVFLGEDAYPKYLEHIYDPPPALFYMGDLSRLNCPQIAIVGTRNPSSYAQKIAFDLASYLAKAGFAITSGLALGVDSCAHRGALGQSASTVGVMGTGIDICYPRQNQALFYQIAHEGGCLISEFLPGAPASRHAFPRRNRLVVGLSLATVIVEAALQSGSTLSARLAAEQGKQVFAVPGRIDNAAAEGCHHLIREGATLLHHPRQILEDLQSCFGRSLAIAKADAKNNKTAVDRKDNRQVAAALPKQAVQKRAQSRAPLQMSFINQSLDAPSQTPNASADIPERLRKTYAALGEDFEDLDSLIRKTGFLAADLLAQLVELELLGKAQQTGGCYAKT